jgi:hypothetical protein
MRLCFLGDDPVLLGHARRLAGRHDVAVSPPPLGASEVTGLTPHQAESEHFDVAIADGWRTTARLFAIPAKRYVRHVSQIEHRTISIARPERVPAALALDLPLDFIAESDGLADFLRALRPEARVAVVPPPREDTGDAAPARAGGDPLRIALAGDESIGREVLDAMTARHEVVQSGPHVVLALGEPQLPARTAAMALRTGAALVVESGPFTDGLVGHRETGLLADPDDPEGTARLLDEAARNGDLFDGLRAAAEARLADWPEADAATAALEHALERFLAEPPPAALAWPSRLMGDAIGFTAEFMGAIDASYGSIDLTNPLQAYVTKLEADLEAIRQERAYRAAVGIRARLRARIGDFLRPS